MALGLEEEDIYGDGMDMKDEDRIPDEDTEDDESSGVQLCLPYSICKNCLL